MEFGIKDKNEQWNYEFEFKNPVKRNNLMERETIKNFWLEKKKKVP